MVKEYGNEEKEVVINIKVVISMIKNQGLVYLHGKQGMYIKETINAINVMVMGKCIGVMIIIIWENGKMEYKMGMVRFICLKQDLEKEYFKIMFQ